MYAVSYPEGVVCQMIKKVMSSAANEGPLPSDTSGKAYAQAAAAAEKHAREWKSIMKWAKKKAFVGAPTVPTRHVYLSGAPQSVTASRLENLAMVITVKTVYSPLSAVAIQGSMACLTGETLGVGGGEGRRRVEGGLFT